MCTHMHISDSSDEDVPERDSKYVSPKKKMKSAEVQAEGATGNSESVSS